MSPERAGGELTCLQQTMEHSLATMPPDAELSNVFRACRAAVRGTNSIRACGRLLRFQRYYWAGEIETTVQAYSRRDVCPFDASAPTGTVQAIVDLNALDTYPMPTEQPHYGQQGPDAV